MKRLDVRLETLFSEDWPAEPDGFVPASLARELGVPPDGGVYVFADLRGPLYVGQANVLRIRFRQHLTASHNGLLTAALDRPYGRMLFYWYIVAPRELSAMEARVIRFLSPVCNKVRYIS